MTSAEKSSNVVRWLTKRVDVVSPACRARGGRCTPMVEQRVLVDVELEARLRRAGFITRARCT